MKLLEWLFLRLDAEIIPLRSGMSKHSPPNSDDLEQERVDFAPCLLRKSYDLVYPVSNLGSGLLPSRPHYRLRIYVQYGRMSLPSLAGLRLPRIEPWIKVVGKFETRSDVKALV